MKFNKPFTYIKINSEDECIKLQQYFMSLGYTWLGYGKQIKYINAKFLVLNKKEMTLMYNNNDKTKYDYTYNDIIMPLLLKGL